ncbi:RED-like protein domain-containing protein [Cladophialophora immunda]|nr:RED-like protein domain-containing protein [Cladophialophora immunda]
MDNSQFRSLLQTGQNADTSNSGASPQAFKKPVLGSRARSSIPMTPRSVAGFNASKMFTQQVSEYRKEHDGQPPTKKFKSSAPKGSKLASGYQDRTLARQADGEGVSSPDDKEKRVKALEEMYKLQQIDEATFEKLKSEIGIGGDLSSTHLVKGLDWKLLERVRRGEDVRNTPQAEKEESAQVNVDDELEEALQKDVKVDRPISRKAQDEAPGDLQEPMTRDAILRRLKESRSGISEPSHPEPALGARFKKVTSEKPNKKKFVEIINGRRREVLLITNKDGTTKRKTRWLEKEEDLSRGDQNQPLGMEVPAELRAKQQALLDQQAAEEEDDDIFQGVADYNPLASINSESEDEGGEKEPTARVDTTDKTAASTNNKPRNYFATSNQEEGAEDRTNPILKDPTLLSALKRAAGLRRNEETSGESGVESDPDKAARQQQLLARLKERDRADAADLDLGFGESRIADDDDEDEPGWDEGEGPAKKSGRKRGPKKRKGDKDNMSDVMAVLQGREKKS